MSVSHSHLSPKQSQNNYWSFLWHSVFLSLATNFMDVDTIVSSMLIKAGGTSVQLGLLTAIMLGGTSLMQLVFASYLAPKVKKKAFLLTGINLRVLSLLLMALLFFQSHALDNWLIILLIFIFMSMFSFSGSFANVSYVDILGKSLLEKRRKIFFSAKQIVNSIGFLTSALIVRELLKYYDYPVNYAFLFFTAGLLLLTASLGFWNLREVVSSPKPKRSLLSFFKSIPAEIKKSRNLKYYLIIINSLGLGLSVLPFLVLFAKESFGLSYTLIGNFLLFRTIGMLVAGLILYKFSQKFIYRHVLQFSLVLGSLLPILALLLQNNQFAYQFIFIFSGIFFATYRMALEGVLLEISTEENRVTFTGISGAGNVLTTVFPLAAGYLVSVLGFHIIFIAVAVLILSSYYFVSKLDCRTPH